MLDHGEPAVVGELLEGGAVVGDVAELKLLELLFVGVEGGTRVRGVHGAFAFRLAAVAGELIVGGRLNGGAAVVDDFGRNVDAVVAAVERVGLLDRHAALGGFKDHVKLVGVAHAELLADELVLILVIREVAADKAALGDVGAVLRDLKKIDVAEVLGWLAVEDETGEAHFGPVGLTRDQRHFGADDDGALAVEGDLHAIGFNDDRILDGDSGRNRGVNVLASRDARGCVGNGLLFNGLRMEKGLLALVDLIVVPQQEAGGKKNRPQKSALHVLSHFYPLLLLDVEKIRRSLVFLFFRPALSAPAAPAELRRHRIQPAPSKRMTAQQTVDGQIGSLDGTVLFECLNGIV